MLIQKLKSFYFYNIKLRIGRFQRCKNCNKLQWIRNECLYDTLYYERQTNERQEISHINCKNHTSIFHVNYEKMWKCYIHATAFLVFVFMSCIVSKMLIDLWS